MKYFGCSIAFVTHQNAKILAHQFRLCLSPELRVVSTRGLGMSAPGLKWDEWGGGCESSRVVDHAPTCQLALCLVRYSVTTAKHVVDILLSLSVKI